MSKTNLVANALVGNDLDGIDRGRLPASWLALLAVGGHITLTYIDRRRLAKSTLALLAVSGVVELTRQERDRLGPHELALVALRGGTGLRDAELARLPGALREFVDDSLPGLPAYESGTGPVGQFPRIAGSGMGRPGSS
jgi:hypothetical protein